jgi:anti-sigma B factor antagonist
MKQSEHDLTIAATLVAGEYLTIAEVASLKPAWLHMLDGAGVLILDLSAVEQFDLAGAQLLLLLQREAIRQHKSLQFSAASAVIQDLFVLLRIFPEIGHGAGVSAVGTS